MRAVVQRVLGASVSVGGEVVGAFEGPGLCVLLGVTHGDTQATAARCAAKVHALRIFDPKRAVAQSAGRLCLPPGTPDREVSASDLGLPLLVVSQFTLYGQTRKGRRPTWELAAPGDVAEPLVADFVAALRARGAQVATGVFAADMAVSMTNDGPVTLIVDVD